MSNQLGVNFGLETLGIRLGAISIPHLGVGDQARKIDAWMPYGSWNWSPVSWRPPVPEFWIDPRSGTWAWQIDRPDKTHILLYMDEKVIGGIADFDRLNFLRSYLHMKGDWIIDHSEWKSGGRWHIDSWGYPRDP